MITVNENSVGLDSGFFVDVGRSEVLGFDMDGELAIADEVHVGFRACVRFLFILRVLWDDMSLIFLLGKEYIGRCEDVFEPHDQLSDGLISLFQLV